MGTICNSLLSTEEKSDLGTVVTFNIMLKSKETNDSYNAQLYVTLNKEIRPLMHIDTVRTLDCIDKDGYVNRDLYKVESVVFFFHVLIVEKTSIQDDKGSV